LSKTRFKGSKVQRFKVQRFRGWRLKEGSKVQRFWVQRFRGWRLKAQGSGFKGSMFIFETNSAWHEYNL
jgi:hypothetical protein